jgi:thiol-disulfide isomerase/thioredoxin
VTTTHQYHMFAVLVHSAIVGSLVQPPAAARPRSQLVLMRRPSTPIMCDREEPLQDPDAAVAQEPPRFSSLSALAATEASALDPVSEQPVKAPMSSAACAVTQSPSERRRSLVMGVTAPLAAACLYTFQRLNPVNPVALLRRMEERSPSLPDALSTGRPTLLEFYAPWCVSCKESAPTMMRLEARFANQVSFVTVNGDDPSNEKLVRLFGVDGVPHFALIDGGRKLQGTLIGDIPDSVLEQSVTALAEGRPLPYGAVQAEGDGLAGG